VISQRDRLKKSLKDNTLPLVDSRDRLYMEGFALDSMKADEVLSYISSVTGLTAWNGEVTSVAFASDESGNVGSFSCAMTNLRRSLIPYRIFTVGRPFSLYSPIGS
jgi:hypothetical protein